jgi:uncharacterized repeat protein (TIGR01451 family)
VAGDTSSGDFPVVNALHPTLTGGSDAFVSKFSLISDLALTNPAGVDANPVGIGAPVSFTFTVTNAGPDLATAVTVTDVLPGNAAFQSARSSQGSCGAPAGAPSTVSCTLGAMASGGTATASIAVTPTAAGALSNGATTSSNSVDPDKGNNAASATTAVTDFTVSVSPATATVTAGQSVGYTVLMTPRPQGASFPNPISLNCPSGVPTQASCIFSTTPITPGATPVTSALTITTTARPPTTTRWFRWGSRYVYAAFLPLAGMLLLGFVGSTQVRRKKRLLLLVGCVLLLSLLLVQPSCGSGSTKPTTTVGTPAGNYAITVNATSGTVSRTTTLKLVVQ